MKMNVTETVKQACGHWPRILPALGVKVIKIPPSGLSGVRRL